MYTALQAVASPLGHSTGTRPCGARPLRADDGIRTRDPHLGKVMRYQLRYVRMPGPTPGRAPTIADALASPSKARTPSGPADARRHDRAVTEHGSAPSPEHAAAAWFGGRLATGLVEVTDDPAALDVAGWWAVVLTYEGELTAARFADVAERGPLPGGCWPGVPEASWQTSHGRGRVRRRGAGDPGRRSPPGDVYQANLCRVLSAPLPDAAPTWPAWPACWPRGNPAPYAGFLRLPDHGVHVATASPELFLRRSGPDGTWSSPGRSRAPAGPRRTCSRRTRPRT